VAKAKDFNSIKDQQKIKEMKAYGLGRRFRPAASSLDFPKPMSCSSRERRWQALSKSPKLKDGAEKLRLRSSLVEKSNDRP
jgi:hypothetical protein